MNVLTPPIPEIAPAQSERLRPETLRVVGQPIAHDSAVKHVSGAALYVDDVAEPRDLLHAFVRLSAHAHARVTRLDVSAAAASPGVAAVITARDIPGINDVGPAFPGDPIFADGLVEYAGQSLFAVAADSIASARAAAERAVVEYDVLAPVLTIDEAMRHQSFVLPTQTMRRGDAAAALAHAPHRLRGRIAMGGQEHFYLEGQVAMAIPGEDRDMHILSSTQHPTEVQHLAARCLAIPDHAVVCETRRMGGGFGGKESQASLIACVAALLAAKTRRPVKLRLDRDDDMTLTGKRHDFRIAWDVGFDADGRIEGIAFDLASRCGMSPDLSAAINDRAMFHSDNAYYFPHVTIVSHRCKTHTVSNTAFRGFGGPQGMMGVEAVMDAIARHLRLDPLVVRRRNFYGKTDRNITPYHMTVEDNIIPELTAELVRTSQYAARRRGIAAFNARSPWIKRGIALTPVKFGISFTLLRMNQAGALVHVYTDGSVQLNHGGTEMGQGLFVKVAQVVAEELGIPLDRVKITATTTEKVPNTSPTAASSGSDLNGKAAQAAARAIRGRIAAVIGADWGVAPADIAFRDGEVRAGARTMPFAAAVRRSYEQRVQLSAAGYYATPKLEYDTALHRGRPFYYFAYGAAVSEVEVDTLTGEYCIRRVDILHDVGRSLNPAIDLGQIEGGFVQGTGWLTTEELWWDAEGRLRTHAPSTYKIPAVSDLPPDFRVSIFSRGRNRESALFRSKAVGEPPLMLGISVFHALRDAVAACGDVAEAAELDAPATPERVLLAIEARRRARRGAGASGGMMRRWLDTLQSLETAGTPAVLVTLLAVRGSTPREAGCKMVVTDADAAGTIGGGNLEFQSIAAARALLTEQMPAPVLREFPLGPALGQCCGGHATVLFEVVRPAAWHVALFGAGHVGRALVTLLGTLDCRVSWIDPRHDAFPAGVPANVACVRDEAPARLAATLRAGSHVLVMTHDHGLDFEIVATLLPRPDLPFIGLIGSETKRARFVSRLSRRGLPPDAIRRLVCPIGLPGAGGKLPAEIAIAAAAQLLQVRDAVAPVAALPARARPVSLVACADCGAAGCGHAQGAVAQ